jgi:xanthosine utilization system XapX-like protein
MNQQQNAFALGTGIAVGIAGSLLATNGIADWSLATVGLGLVALAGVQSLQQATVDRTDHAGNANRYLQQLR